MCPAVDASQPFPITPKPPLRDSFVEIQEILTPKTLQYFSYLPFTLI